MTEQPEQPDLKPKASPIALMPATVEACASDLRSRKKQAIKAGDAAAQRGAITPKASF
ncbi:hypothetical protein ACIQI8_27315 [Streptomyces sp. NPDC092369]|uniref:hypothetical protein n=1 Tax=Streptomyces sp. NPDC092369 TaxID=3366015 RepID=UPI003823ED7C